MILIATISTGAVYGLVIGGLVAAGLCVIWYLHLPPKCPKCGLKQPDEPAHGWRRCNRCHCKFDPVTGKRL